MYSKICDVLGDYYRQILKTLIKWNNTLGKYFTTCNTWYRFEAFSPTPLNTSFWKACLHVLKAFFPVAINEPRCWSCTTRTAKKWHQRSRREVLTWNKLLRKSKFSLGVWILPNSTRWPGGWGGGERRMDLKKDTMQSKLRDLLYLIQGLIEPLSSWNCCWKLA